jgi:hypothetical protein
MLDRHISRREGGNDNVYQENGRVKVPHFRIPATLEALGDAVTYSQKTEMVSRK